MSRRGWLLFTAMGVIWGIPYLLIKVAVGALTPATLVFLRTGTGALLLLPFAARRGWLTPLLRHWRALLLYTVVEVGVPWLLLSDAERQLTSSLSGLLVAAVPLIGALLAWMGRSDDRVDARRLAGLLTGLGGVAVLLGVDVAAGSAFAVAEVGVVTVGYAVGPLIISRRLSDLPAMSVVAASLAVCAVAYAPYGLTHLPGSRPDAGAIASVVVLGVVCTAIAFLFFFQLIAEVGPVRATVITYVNPAVAVVLGVLVLHEAFTLGTAAGFVLIISGSFLSTRRPRRVATEPGEATVEPALGEEAAAR